MGGILVHANVMCSLSALGATMPYNPIHYSDRMSPENAHELMGFYMEVLVLGVIL